MTLPISEAQALLRAHSGSLVCIELDGTQRDVTADQAVYLVANGAYEAVSKSNRKRVRRLIAVAPKSVWRASYHNTEAPVLPVSPEWLRRMYGKPGSGVLTLPSGNVAENG